MTDAILALSSTARVFFLSLSSFFLAVFHGRPAEGDSSKGAGGITGSTNAPHILLLLLLPLLLFRSPCFLIPATAVGSAPSWPRLLLHSLIHKVNLK